MGQSILIGCPLLCYLYNSIGLNAGPQLVSSSLGGRAYLPGIGVNHDQEGGSPRARLGHCTQAELTSAISPNVGNSDAKFISWGTAFALSPPHHLINQVKTSSDLVSKEVFGSLLIWLWDIRDLVSSPLCAGWD